MVPLTAAATDPSANPPKPTRYAPLAPSAVIARATSVDAITAATRKPVATHANSRCPPMLATIEGMSAAVK